MRLVFLTGVLACVAHGELLPIVDDSYPYVKFSNAKSLNVHWQHGYVAQRLASSRAVRVNGRGVKFISGRHSQLRLDPLVWKSVRCVHDPDALCRIEFQGAVVSKVFPSWPSEVFSMMDTGQTSDYVRQLLPGHCPETKSGRIVSDDTRDVSLCDIIGANGDFVYDIKEEILYISDAQMAPGIVVLTSLGTIYAAILLSKNLDLVLRTEQKDERSPLWSNLTPIPLGAILGFIILPEAFAGTSFLAALVTREDQMLFMVLLLFSAARIIPSLLYGLYQVVALGKGLAKWESMYIVNPLICILILISVEFYCTADNPYTLALTSVFAIRWTMKVHNMEWSQKRECVQLLVDAVILSSLLYYSIAVFYDHNLSHVALFALQTWGVGMAIHMLVKDYLV